ncbi:DUF928 domain-containing protein [Anabaena sp. WFMT]|uniref:DUF928 domain-containing protein n=1 Tax=Anabaena sp. WFMT TaxID=3449730 RepID=UPI003F293D3C
MQKYIGLTLLVGLSISLVSTPVKAQIEFIKPEQAADEKYRWQRQEPGYAGCPCGCRKSKLLAIVPNNYPSLTVSSRPVFFVHVPKIDKQYINSSDGKLDAEFRLVIPATEEEVYSTKISISQEGITEINLPKNVLELEVDKDYLWELAIVCNIDDYHPINVGGLVRRVKPSAKLISALEQANSLQTAVIYAKNGIWIEALSTLIQLRRQSPQNLRVMYYWRSLLKSVDLQKITEQPLLKLDSNAVIPQD